MKILKANLQKALEIVKPGLAAKEIIEQSTSFAFADNLVVTYNDHVCISHPIEGVSGLNGAIKADSLYSFLSKIKKDEIDLEVTENEMILKSGKAKAGMTFQSEVKLPIDSIGEHGKWAVLPEDFWKYMKFAMGSCSRDMSQPKLTCVHVNKAGIIESSDNFRMTRCQLQPFKFNTFLIPANSVEILVKLTPVKIAEGKGWIHFMNEERTMISCRIYENDTFPDSSKYLNIKGQSLTFPNTIIAALDRASVFCKRDHLLDEQVFIKIENKKFTLRAESESGWFEETLNINYDKTPINFVIIPYLLKDILSETLTCTIGENQLKFAKDNWIYITARS